MAFGQSVCSDNTRWQTQQNSNDSLCSQIDMMEFRNLARPATAAGLPEIDDVLASGPVNEDNAFSQRETQMAARTRRNNGNGVNSNERDALLDRLSS